MCPDNDEWMMKKIFHLSDHALIRMVNHLFGTEYEDGEYVQKEWKEAGGVRICLLIGCANRYEFQMRRFGKCLQICAEDRGCLFHYKDAAEHAALQVREPDRASFGKNTREKYCTILELQGKEQIVLPVYDITVSDRSVWHLEEAGLILFLPFLFYCFLSEPEMPEIRQESLKSFVIRDIVGALHVSMKKGDLTIFDVQRLKSCCKSMLLRVLSGERWMQDRGLLELVLSTLDVDIDLLETIYRRETAKESVRVPGSCCGRTDE